MVTSRSFSALTDSVATRGTFCAVASATLLTEQPFQLTCGRGELIINPKKVIKFFWIVDQIWEQMGEGSKFWSPTIYGMHPHLFPPPPSTPF